MRVCDIEIGEFYRLKRSPNYGYVKPLAILKSKEKENENNFIIVKGKYVVDTWQETGIIRYFRPRDIKRRV